MTGRRQPRRRFRVSPPVKSGTTKIVTTEGVNAAGKTVDNVAVYERQ
jgi:hypothetical protein